MLITAACYRSPLRHTVLGKVFCCEPGTAELGSLVPPCKASMVLCTLFDLSEEFSDLIIRLIDLNELPEDSGPIC